MPEPGTALTAREYRIVSAPMLTSVSRERIVGLLERATGLRIAVIGDAMLDVYLRGDVERISPEAPVPVVRVRERTHALGGAANVAQNVVATGARCELVGAIGADAGGQVLRGMLEAVDIGTRCLVEVVRPTTTKTRVIARAQQVVRVDEEEDADLGGNDVERLLESAGAAIEEADALVLEDYNKGVLVPRLIRHAISRAQGRGIPIVVDPKYKNFFLYRGTTIFKPNRRELEAALGAAVDLEHPAALPDTLRRLGAEHLVLTLSEHGMVLISSDSSINRVPTVAREVYDPVGAGDTVTAYLATMLAAGGSAVEAAVIANYAAGVEVGKRGAQTVTPTEVLDAYEEFRQREFVANAREP